MGGFAADIHTAIQDAARNGLEVRPPEGVLSGFAGEKLTGLLQRFPKLTTGAYLEIGTYQGSSLLHTALANPDIECFGIDNFAFFDPSGANKQMVIDRARTLGVSNYILVEKDFEDTQAEWTTKVGTYFIDGPHDYRSQFICLAHAPRFMSRNGVILVDDANYPHVRKATADFLRFWPEYKLDFEAYSDCHPYNMTEAQLAEAKAGWWGGVHVIVHDPDDSFEGLAPPCPDNSQFIRDHEVHAGRWAPVAAYALDAVSAVVRPWEMPRAIAKTIRERLRTGGEIKGRYRFCNTDSEGLPTRLAQINKGKSIY